MTERTKFNLEGVDLENFEQVSPERRKEWEAGLKKFQEDMSKASRHNRGGLIPTHPHGMPLPRKDKELYDQNKKLWDAIRSLEDTVKTQAESISELTDIVRSIIRSSK